MFNCNNEIIFKYDANIGTKVKIIKSYYLLRINSITIKFQ